jgi:hypothetical protein
MENINTSFPNDGLGDKVRNAFIKVNNNFTELNTNKVNKITGKGLSTEDYSTAEKALVALTDVLLLDATIEIRVYN